MNTHVKILSKILPSQIQEHIKKVIYHDQVELIPGIQVCFNICKSINVVYYIGKTKDKNNDYLNRYIKSIWEHATSFYNKNPQYIIEGTELNMIKATYNKPIANIAFNGEKF